MRFGLISDVHADVEALRQAIRLLHSRAVDRILCLGDLVERGPWGGAVAELIQTEKVLCIAGKHDLTAEANLNWYRQNARQFNLDLSSRELMPQTLTRT